MNKFFPSKIITKKEVLESNLNYALIILNRPIQIKRELIETLWNNSLINITVDGGTNRWLNFLKNNNLENKLKHPTLITGDLDSCHAESLKFFTQTKVIQTVDQDETDFTKCLRVLEPFINELKLDHTVVICENSGRLDHIIANINTLYKNQLKSNEISRPVFMLSSTSISFLLPEGKSEIHIPECAKKLWCALMPIAGPTTVSTEGLKWNMKNFEMKFGGLVSTSNKYDGISDFVKVECNLPILWSMGICDEI
ncbi:hypothetical protein PVAND_016547 [Polypedilum vanderplanki]|uniref:Thiamin pyrophosphokinase thiamin-binding domain-containing protein n=1 Tax=Polypedilum vanderplanki TaxID=319348 RepID=A0A9J6BGH7_POLVA|nr:hypothetical protein PVAND_016547 [Polypedilum vanderplanki]